MAKGKKVQPADTSTASVTTTAAVEKPVINDSDTVTIVNANLVGKVTSTSLGNVEFDKDGKAKVSGEIAKLLLSCSKNFSVEGQKKEKVETATATEEKAAAEEVSE